MRTGIPKTRHVPMMLDAEKIDDTRHGTCLAADQFCPPSQFPLRHVVVRPIPVTLITSQLLTIAQSLVGIRTTTEQAIQFQCGGGQPLDPQNFVILELDKPAA